MRHFVFYATAASLLCFAAAAATIPCSRNAAYPTFVSVQAAHNASINTTACRKIAIVAVDTIQTALNESNSSPPPGFARSSLPLDQVASRRPSGCCAPQTQLQSLEYEHTKRSSGVGAARVISVIIGKHRNSPDKSSAPWFLDGPAGGAADALTGGEGGSKAEGKSGSKAEGKSGSKARGGINPYVPQQEYRHHHDAFIRFISDDRAGKGRFTGHANYFTSPESSNFRL